MPQITVIVPVYNVEPYLHRCVDSILAQTYTDFELILVDDGSPDNCPSICDAYAAQDERVRVIHQPNGGLSAARNAGIDWAFANSDSQWLTFIDSDDWVHKEYLERLLDAAVTQNVSISLCGFERTEGAEADVQDNMPVYLWTPEDFYVKDNVTATTAWGKLYWKSCFEEIRYPVGKIHEDEFVTYRILFEQEQIAVIDAPLYMYYQNPQSIMGSPWSERKMVSIEAIEGQLQYMEDKGFCAALREIRKRYIYNMSNHLLRLEASDVPNKKELAKQLRRKMQRALLKWHKLIEFKDNKWTYEIAFPRLMQCYWIAESKWNTLTKKKS